MIQRMFVNLDTKKTNYKNVGKINHGDDLILELTVLSDGDMISFNNPMVDLLVKKSDGKMIRQNSGIEHIKPNKFIIEVSKDCVTSPGLTTNQLIINDDGRISTCMFYYTILNSLEEDIIESISNVEVLEQLDEFTIQIKDKMENFDEELQNRMSELEDAIDDLVEFFGDTSVDLLEAELSRNEAEQSRTQAESVRVQNESRRLQNDLDLANAEAERVRAENVRIQNEVDRALVDAVMDQKESKREDSELERIQNESKRTTDELVRQQNENVRQSNEVTRIANESDRKTQENRRATAETNRVNAETTRRNNENSRISNETERQKTMNEMKSVIDNVNRLDERVDVIEDDIEDINSSLETMKNLSDDPILHGAIDNVEIDSCEVFSKLIGGGYVLDLKGKTFKLSNTITVDDLRLKNGTIIGDSLKTLFNVKGNIFLDNITIKDSNNAIQEIGSSIKNRKIEIVNCTFDGNSKSISNNFSKYTTSDLYFDISINNSKFINGKWYDVYLYDCSITKCSITNCVFENGTNEALLMNPIKATSGNYIINNNIFRNYTNTLTGDDNDSHFIRCTGKKAIINNNIFDGLYVLDGLGVVDTEALRPVCDELTISNNIFKNAGFKEGFLALKECYYCKIMNNRFECTDEYKNRGTSIAILCGHGVTEIINNTFMNFNGNIVDTQDTSTLPTDTIKIINNTIIDCTDTVFRITANEINEVIIKGNTVTTSKGNEDKLPYRFLFSKAGNKKILLITDNIIKADTYGFDIGKCEYTLIKNNHISFGTKLFSTLNVDYIEMSDNFIGDVTDLSFNSWFGSGNVANHMVIKDLKFTVSNVAEGTRVFRVPYGTGTKTDLTVKINLKNDNKFYVIDYNALFLEGTNEIYINPSNKVVGEDSLITLRGSSNNSLYYSTGITTPNGLNSENNHLSYTISCDSYKV